jgi:hypothetical protein
VTGHYAVGVLLESCLADKLRLWKDATSHQELRALTKLAAKSPQHNRGLWQKTAENAGCIAAKEAAAWLDDA